MLQLIYGTQFANAPQGIWRNKYETKMKLLPHSWTTIWDRWLVLLGQPGKDTGTGGHLSP